MKSKRSIKEFTSPMMAIIAVIVSIVIPEFRIYWIEPLATFEMEDALIFLVLFIILSFAGIIIIAKFMGKSIIKMENHIVVGALRESNRFVIWFVFPMTMVFEEVLFRAMLLGSLISYGGLSQWAAILTGAVIFSLYHLHTWPSFKDWRITLSFMGFSFILGIACGYFMFIIGIIGAIALHWFSVFLIFQDIFTKIERDKPKPEIPQIDLNYAASYLNFTAILAGLSFAILFVYLGIAPEGDFDVVFIVMLAFSTACFLIATAAYADCVKIKDGKFRRQLPGGEWEEKQVDFFKNIHLPDQLTLFGFIVMMFALGISGFKNSIWWGILTCVIVGIGFFLLFKVYPSHGKEKYDPELHVLTPPDTEPNPNQF